MTSLVVWRGASHKNVCEGGYYQWRSQPKMFGPASSAEGARFVGVSRGILPRKILKTRTSEMPFPTIWALTYMGTSFTEIRVITLANLTYIIAKKCDRSRFYIKFVCLRSLSEVMTWPPHADINIIISRHYAARNAVQLTLKGIFIFKIQA